MLVRTKNPLLYITPNEGLENAEINYNYITFSSKQFFFDIFHFILKFRLHFNLLMSSNHKGSYNSSDLTKSF